MDHNFFKLFTKELKFCLNLMDYILSRSSVILVLLSRKLEMYKQYSLDPWWPT